MKTNFLMLNQVWGTMFYPEGFANFGYFYGFLLKSHFFYTLDVGRNGYWRNIVTTSLFMTLVLLHNKLLQYLVTILSSMKGGVDLDFEVIS